MERLRQDEGFRPDTGPGPGVVLGRGRSGVVVRLRDDLGRDVARKIFLGEPTSKLVHIVLSGAPSAYIWCEPAVLCTLHRRRILADLVEHWFGSRLRVARAFETAWNGPTHSYRLDTEFVAGRPAALHHPFSAAHEGEARQLRTEIMRPLQRRLAESGFDGLVWQAGRGNPVAANNFLRDAPRGAEPRWSWIDLESGVPALFPINPLDLVLFYLPKSLRHRRPLYDDVDLDRLRSYLAQHAETIESSLGAERFAAMQAEVDGLEIHQRAWKAIPRIRRGIAYRLGQERITAEQADWYARHPLRWYAREARLGGAAVLRAALGWTRRWLRRLARFDYIGALGAVGRYVSSQRYRSDLAHAYVDLRIDRWERRGQIEPPEAAYLRDALHHEEVGSYITDFGVHVALKPPLKLLQWIVFPALLALGWIGPAGAAAGIAFGGMVCRTVYTLSRSAMGALRGERLPWVALAVGLLPVVGTAAYPVQIVWRGAERSGKLAGFILYDSVTIVGEFLPIWGGCDTATEHRFNRIGDLVVRDRRPPV